MPLLSDQQTWKILARSSPLSRKQVEEVKQELQSLGKEAHFDVTFVDTSGDLDRTTSLRQLEKTDFFTREIDQGLLNGEGRIAIHSAKDLPAPLPEGLRVVAYTKGVDSSDSLVLPEGASLDSLPPGSRIATSSERREAAVRAMHPNLTFCDVRGNIGERLSLLEKGEVQGVVIAEAAIIRLNLTHLNRVRLPGDTVPYQGRLAIVARSDDEAARAFFSCLDHGPE